MLKNKELTSEQEGMAKVAVKRNVEDVAKLLGRLPSFEEYINHVFEVMKQPKEIFEPTFQGFMKGWQLNGYPEADFTTIYNEMFDSTNIRSMENHSLNKSMQGKDHSNAENINFKEQNYPKKFNQLKILLIAASLLFIILLICCCIYEEEIRELFSNWFTLYLVLIILNIIHCVEVRRHREKFDLKMQYISIPYISVYLTLLVYLCLCFFLTLAHLVNWTTRLFII